MEEYKAGDTVKLKPIEEWEFDEDGEHLGLTKDDCRVYAENVYNIQGVHDDDDGCSIEFEHGGFLWSVSVDTIDELWEDDKSPYDFEIPKPFWMARSREKETDTSSEIVNHEEDGKWLNDPIKPKHYNSKIDVYDFCLANDLGLLEGNCIKYLTRYKNKNGLEDLLKAQETLKRLIKHYESN